MIVAVLEKVPAKLVPAMLMEQTVDAAVLPLPVFVRVSVQTGETTLVHTTELALTRAVLVNVPKRPNTKPATAIAAMRVMAMRMTVASTGEMAFLFFL